MGLYSGGLMIGRTVLRLRFGGLILVRALFIYLLLFFFFVGGGGIIEILQYLTRATSSYLRKKAGFFSIFTAKNTYSTEKSSNEDAESHEASTNKEIQELTDAVMKTFSLENPIHHIHKWPPYNFFFGYVFKEIHVPILSSTIKYVILRSFSIFGLTPAKLWLIQI